MTNAELLAGVSRLTVATLQGNEVLCSGLGPDEHGKFEGWIMHGPEKHCRAIISTQPIFDSADVAKAHMEAVVKAARDEPSVIDALLAELIEEAHARAAGDSR